MAILNSSGSGGSGSLAGSTSVDTATIENISIGTANTEQSHALPALTRKFRLKARGFSITKLAYTSGQSGTVYVTVSPGSWYCAEMLDPNTTYTIYFQTSKVDTLEVESWQDT